MADLLISIIGDASKLKGALGNAEGHVSSFSGKVSKIGKIATAAGVAVTAAFTAIVLKTAAAGDQFDKMSLRTGIAVEELSGLAYASDICGSDIGTLEKGLKYLTTSLDDASRGIGEGIIAFKDLDIAVVDSEGNLRSTVDVLKEAATKISEIEDPTKQAARAIDLFGAKAGPRLLPLLKMGEAGIEELMAEAKRLGITFTTEAATAAAEFTDRMTDLKGSLFGAGRMIGDTLIPVVTPLIEKVVEIVGRVKEWAEGNKPLVEGIFKMGAALGVALAVLGPIAIVLPSLITGFTLLAPAMLPFAIGGAIVLGIKKLSDYLGEVKIKAFEIATEFREWDLERLDRGISEVTKIIEDLEAEVEGLDKGFTVFGVTLKNQDVNIDRLTQVIKDYKIELGLLKEQRDKLTKAEEEGIDVAEERARIDEEAEELLETITQKEEKLREELEAKTKAAELANAQMEIENDIYALTHTAMEVSVRDLDSLKQGYLEKGIAIEIVNEWYELEITRLGELNKVQEEHIDTMGEVARVTKAVENAIYELTHEPYEVKIKEINERYDDYIIVIKESTLSIIAQETAIRNINIARDEEIKKVDKTTEAEKEAKKQKDILIDAYKELEDRIYELTHDEMEYNIKKLDEQKQRYIDLGMSIGWVMEWYDAEIVKLGEVGDAFTGFEKIAGDAIKKVVGYIVSELSPAIENLLFGMEDFEWEWEDFWSGLWSVLKKYISNMIAKLVIAIPLMLIWGAITGGLSWATFWTVWNFLGFEKGGGVGFDKGGQVKGFQHGGVADTIPAKLTIGEYVIAKPMTDFIRQFRAIPGNLVDAISRGMPTPAPAFAGGGLVGGAGISSTDFGGTTIYVDIHDNRISDDVDIKKLSATVSNEILRKLSGRRRF